MRPSERCGPTNMKPKADDKLISLCGKISREKDREKMSLLIDELIDLLNPEQAKKQRLSGF